MVGWGLRWWDGACSVRGGMMIKKGEKRRERREKEYNIIIIDNNWIVFVFWRLNASFAIYILITMDHNGNGEGWNSEGWHWIPLAPLTMGEEVKDGENFQSLIFNTGGQWESDACWTGADQPLDLERLTMGFRRRCFLLDDTSRLRVDVLGGSSLPWPCT